MDKKIEETREFLQTIGMPKAQQADICCYVILAMAGIKPDMSWGEATNEWIRIHDIIQFVNTFYDMSYAENRRETFRKQALHRFRTAALIEDNGKATNSPNYRYRLTEETIKILRTMETPAWKESIKRFLCYHEKLIDLYASKKKMTMMPVNINGKDFKFSAGKHNELQKAIIEEFAPRFAPSSECLYVGDTIQKDLVKNVDNIVGIKDTIDSVAHLRSMIHTVKGAHPHFTVLCGYDDHLFNTLLLGGDGAISASGNFAPQVSVNLLKAWRDGDVAKAAEYHQTLLQIPQLYQLDTPFVNVIKEAIVLCGRPISTHVLPPASPLDEPRKAQLKSLLQQLKLC